MRDDQLEDGASRHASCDRDAVLERIVEQVALTRLPRDALVRDVHRHAIAVLEPAVDFKPLVRRRHVLFGAQGSVSTRSDGKR